MSYQELDAHPPDSIDWQTANDLSQWLDDNVSEIYKNQPLAQDWARISKVSEELGEAIAEFISWTGQNPRKPVNSLAYRAMMLELADTALTAIYAMIHFSDAGYARLTLSDRIQQHAHRIGLYPHD